MCKKRIMNNFLRKQQEVNLNEIKAYKNNTMILQSYQRFAQTHVRASATLIESGSVHDISYLSMYSVQWWSVEYERECWVE